jgi:hypothetical protein
VEATPGKVYTKTIQGGKALQLTKTTYKYALALGVIAEVTLYRAAWLVSQERERTYGDIWTQVHKP